MAVNASNWPQGTPPMLFTLTNYFSMDELLAALSKLLMRGEIKLGARALVDSVNKSQWPTGAATMSACFPITQLLVSPAAIAVAVSGPHIHVLDSKYAFSLRPELQLTTINHILHRSGQETSPSRPPVSMILKMRHCSEPGRYDLRTSILEEDI